MESFLSRWLSPSGIKTLGLWLIIVGLLADGAVILWVASGADKLPSFVCDAVIALGVWIEHVGDHAKDRPRHLSLVQQDRISEKLRSFWGLRAVLGAVPASAENVSLLEEILAALKAANVDAFINLRGTEASINPGNLSHHRTGLRGFPSGIHVHFVDGNGRGRAFAEALSGALNAEGIAASSFPDNMDDGHIEHWIKNAAQQGASLTRESKEFEPVTVVVGDKP